LKLQASFAIICASQATDLNPNFMRSVRTLALIHSD